MPNRVTALSPLRICEFHRSAYDNRVNRMKFPGSLWRAGAWLLGVGVMLAGSGCFGIFVPKHKVLVDAISAPGVTKPTGKSYRLVAKKTTVTQAQVDVKVVKACLDAALVGLGMFEPPPNVAPEIFIEVSYGTDMAGRTDPSGRETFLQLSARDNPGRSVDKATGTELWDVRVAVLGLAGRVEAAMPLLSAVAVTHLATDSHMETKIDIPRNSPMINSVREAAIKNLEGGTPPAGATDAAALTPVK